MADNAIVAIDSAGPRARGWIKKIERRREGKVWVGFFHLDAAFANAVADEVLRPSAPYVDPVGTTQSPAIFRSGF